MVFMRKCRFLCFLGRRERLPLADGVALVDGRDGEHGVGVEGEEAARGPAATRVPAASGGRRRGSAFRE